jgi:hypothetical protein
MNFNLNKIIECLKILWNTIVEPYLYNYYLIQIVFDNVVSGFLNLHFHIINF